MSTRLHHVLKAFSLLALLGLSACADFRVPALDKLKSAGDEGEKTKDEEKKPEAETNLVGQTPQSAMSSQDSVNLGFLLTMNYAEAKTISGQSMEFPTGVRVAADTVEVLKLDRDNQPKRVRARGKVYLENGDGQDQAKILCQEAYITSSEIILRGKPIIQRGKTIIEGLDDLTVAYLFKTRLRIIGPHRLTNQDSMLAMLPDLGPWTGGPNPILPPLAEDAVPNDIRDAMLKAAEAEAVLQQNRVEALKSADAPPAPWIKDDPKAKTSSPAVNKETKESVKPTSKPSVKKAA